MSIFPIKKEDQVMPMPRRVVEKPPEVRMSESYARAIQEFQDIQSTLNAAQKERDELKVDLGVEQRENERLRHTIETLEEQVKLYKERVIAIEARFDDAATLILKVIDSRLTEKARPVPIETIGHLLEQDLTASSGGEPSKVPT